MNTTQELKIENSRQLSNVALVLLPAIGVLVGIVLQFRIVGDLFWWLSGGAAIASACSIYLGGLGISKLRREQNSRVSLFNLQAVLVVISFSLLVFSYLANGVEKTNDLQKRMDGITQDVGALTERLRGFELKTSSYERQTILDLESLNKKLSQSKDNNNEKLVAINSQLRDIKLELEKVKGLIAQEKGPKK